MLRVHLLRYYKGKRTTACGRGGADPELTRQPEKVTCKYCLQWIKWFQSSPAASWVRLYEYCFLTKEE